MQPLLVPGTLDSLSVIGKYVNESAAEAGLDKKAAYHLRLAVDEIATNIIIHGYDEAGLTGEVRVLSDLDQNALTITLEDSSAPFDPRNLGRPGQLDQPVEERPIGGLGIYLTIENVDKFDYEYVNKLNRNIFIVKRPAGAAAKVG
jgi:anti-sigma regulatory factor (Ser/Thr protein kinase)